MNGDEKAPKHYPKGYTQVILNRLWISFKHRKTCKVTMDTSAYQKLDANQASKTLADFSGILPGSPIDSQTVQIMAAPTSFYPDTKVYDILDRGAHPPRGFTVVAKGKATTLVDYSVKTLQEMNDNYALRLSDETVCDYLRFYFRYVQGSYGRFNLIESVEDIAWREEPPSTAKKALSDIIESLPQAMAYDEDEKIWFGKLSFIFQTSLFQAIIIVAHTGEVTIRDQKLVIDQMPVAEDVVET